ncbi:MAG: DUF2288 domain-containing protein [Fibrobacterales bacterium]
MQAPVTPELDETTAEKLTRECAPVSWEHIRPHFERDAVIIASKDLDIISIGTHIAEDNSEAISQEVAAGNLSKPLESQISQWDTSGATFNTLIISPFVLIQEF